MLPFHEDLSITAYLPANSEIFNFHNIHHYLTSAYSVPGTMLSIYKHLHGSFQIPKQPGKVVTISIPQEKILSQRKEK